MTQIDAEGFLQGYLTSSSDLRSSASSADCLKNLLVPIARTWASNRPGMRCRSAHAYISKGFKEFRMIISWAGWRLIFGRERRRIKILSGFLTHTWPADLATTSRKSTD